MTESVWFNELEIKLKTRTAVIGVVGLGYVGLPLATAFLGEGVAVRGFDIDRVKIEKLRSGQSYIGHIGHDVIERMNASGLFMATADACDLASCDVVVICVPTPLDKHRGPDLSYVRDTAGMLATILSPGRLIVLESTSYPGTTSEDVKPILEKSGLVSGIDLFLAFSPEREDPANQEFNMNLIPKVVGGDDRKATILAKLLYEIITPRVIPVGSARVAEAVKLTENIFRSVNIALVNELKVIFSEMGIDIWEVIDAAKTKPFGFMPFYPGPGVGGHCIPVDPFYLAWKSREFGINARFVELAGEINAAMPDYVMNAMVSSLNRRFQISLARSRILILGVSYKKNVGDVRESPALVLMEKLIAGGAAVSYFDPHVPQIPTMREHKALIGRSSIAWDAVALDEYDAVLIATDHDLFDIEAVVLNARLIIDTRNATAGIKDRSKIVMA